MLERKPLIDGIKILHVDGLGGGDGSGSRKNTTDEVIDSALRYRVQAPMVDSILSEIGIEGGNLSKMGGLIREARDLESIRKAQGSDGGGDGGSGSGGGESSGDGGSEPPSGSSS